MEFSQINNVENPETNQVQQTFCDCGCGLEVGSIEFQKLHAPEALLGYFPSMLELCECGCTAQVHQLATGKCGNPQCNGIKVCKNNVSDAEECIKFKGTGRVHPSAFERTAFEQQFDEITGGMSEQEWREECNPGPSELYKLAMLKASQYD